MERDEDAEQWQRFRGGSTCSVWEVGGLEERDRPRQRKGWALRAYHGKECRKNPE